MVLCNVLNMIKTIPNKIHLNVQVCQCYKIVLASTSVSGIVRIGWHPIFVIGKNTLRIGRTGFTTLWCLWNLKYVTNY